MTQKISPIAIGAGLGRFLIIDYPKGGKVVHSALGLNGAILIWVRHDTDAEKEIRAFSLAGPSNEFEASANFVSAVQFEMQIQKPPPVIVTAQNQNGASGGVEMRQITIFIFDDGLATEAELVEIQKMNEAEQKAAANESHA